MKQFHQPLEPPEIFIYIYYIFEAVQGTHKSCDQNGIVVDEIYERVSYVCQGSLLWKPHQLHISFETVRNQ